MFWVFFFIMIIQILILEKQIKLDEFLELFLMEPQCSDVLDVVRLRVTFGVGDELIWSNLTHG